MVGAAFVFSIMGAAIKLASARHSVFEVVLYRGIVATLLIGLWAAALGRGFGSDRMRLHASRSIVGAIAMCCFFYTIGVLPLGTAITLNYTSPLFIALIVAVIGWMRSTRVAGRRWLQLAIAASFLGVLLILRPSAEREHGFELALGLLSGFLGALAYLQVRELGRLGEPEWRTVFWFSATCVLMGAGGTLLTGWHPLDVRGAGLMIAIGVLAMLGQLMMTRAFSRGNTLLTANLQYLGVIFATSIGWLAFDDRLEGIELAGMALIAVSGIAATRVSSAAPAGAATRTAGSRAD